MGFPSASTVLDPALDEEAKQEKEVDGSGPRVRCPLCGWSLRKDDHWFCSCGCRTYSTLGRDCPACLHHWTSTQCLSCAGRCIL